MDNDIRVAVILRDKKLRNDSADTLILGETIPEWNAVELKTVTPEHDVISFNDKDAEKFEKLKKNMLIPQKEGESFDKKGNKLEIGQDIDLGLMIIKRGNERFTQPDLASYAKVIENNKTLLEPYVMHTNIDGNKWKNIPFMNDDVIYTINEEDIGISDDINKEIDKTLVHRLTVEVVVDGKVDYVEHYDIKDGTLIDANFKGFYSHRYPGYKLKTFIDPFTMQYSMRYVLEFIPVYSPDNVVTNKVDQFYDVIINWVMKDINYRVSFGDVTEIRKVPSASMNTIIPMVRKGTTLDQNILHRIPNVRISKSNLPIIIDSNKTINIELEYTGNIPVLSQYEGVTFDHRVIKFSRDGGTSSEGLHIYSSNNPFNPNSYRLPENTRSTVVNKLVADRNYKFTIINYIYNNNIIDSEEFITFNTNTINLHIPTGYSLGESPVIGLGQVNNVNVIRSILTNTLLFIDNVSGEIIHRQSFTGFTGDIINRSKINMPFGYTIINNDNIIIDSARTKRILVDHSIVPQIKIDPQRTLHRVNIKYIFNDTLISTELVSIRGWRKPIITFPEGYKAKNSNYFDGWNPNKGEFVINVIPKLQRINIEVRDKRNNIIIRNISKDIPYNTEFNPVWVTDVVKGFKIENTDYDHEIIRSSGNFTVYGTLEQYWSINVPFKESLTGDLKDDISMPEITFNKYDMVNKSRYKAKNISIWKYPDRLPASVEALLSIHNSNTSLEINNLIKELRSENITNLTTVTDIISDKEMRVKVNKVMKNDMFFNRIIELNTFNKLDLFALDEYSYNSIEDYHVADALEQIVKFNEYYLEYTMKFPFGYMITNIKEDNLYHSIMQDLVFYTSCDDSTSVIKFDIDAYNKLISKLNEYIDLVINLKINVPTGYTSPHLNLHEDLIALANGRILRDLQNVPSDINLTSIPEYIGMNAYGRLNANISKLRIAIMSDDIHGLIINRFKYRKSDIPNDHGLDPNNTWIYDDYGYITWDNATKLVELIQDIYNLAGNLTITEGNKGNNELIAVREIDVSSYNKTLMQKMYDLFYHNMDNMVETILSEERRNHILENNAVNSLKYSWSRLKINLPKLMTKFITNDIEKMSAMVFKKFVYPFFAIFELLYTVSDNNHIYSNIYKDYSYFRNEAKKTNWLSKEDDLLIRNIMKDMSKLVTTFRKYYKGGGMNEFYKNVIERVCHTPLSTKDIQAFNGIAGIDNIAKLNRSLDYRPAIYLDDIFPESAPVKRLSWFGSNSIAINDKLTYSYFINDRRFNNKYVTPSHTWTDLVIDSDTRLNDSNVNWYVDPKEDLEVKKTRYLTLGERIYKLLTHVLKNNAVILDRYINLINNFYSSVEDPIKYGWHKIHLKHINLDDRLIRSMGSFIDVHIKLQNIESEVHKISDTTKPYIFSNTMSITDNASEYVNAKIQWKNDTNNPKIVCSLFSIYDNNLHIAKIECNSDGIPIRVYTTVYGNRKCKPVFIAPSNSDCTLIIKSGVDFTLNCATAEVIASKISNADINKYDKMVLLDSKFNGDITINHTGETPTDKTIIWGSNDNKTIYSKFETIGEIDSLSVIPEFINLTLSFRPKSLVLTPGYNLESRIDRRNIINKRRFWNENYRETIYTKLEARDIHKKQLININSINNTRSVFNDNIVWEDIKVLPSGIPVEINPHENSSETFTFTASFVDRNGQPIPETESIAKNIIIKKSAEGKLNKKWIKRHPNDFRFIPNNGKFWERGSVYYLEIIDGNDNVIKINSEVNQNDINNGYISYLHNGTIAEGNIIVTFVIHEVNKFRSLATIEQYEQLEVLPDEYFIVNNIELITEDKLMNKPTLNAIIDYEKAILGKVSIRGEDMPLVLPPNIKINIDTLAPYVKIKINPTDNTNLIWEYSFSLDRLNYKYNYRKPIITINENNTKTIYDFIKNIGSYEHYDTRINDSYDLYPNIFIAKPGKSYKITVETCDFDGTELNVYEYTKTFTDNHITNSDSSKFLKNSTDNTFLPNSISYPTGNDKFIWLYNDIDKPMITDSKIFGVSMENGVLTELPNYDRLSNINGEYIDNDTMEQLEFGEYIKWTVDNNIGYPAIENAETYLRNERISPSLLGAGLDVSLSSRDKSTDDEADYFINVNFTHKYIRDPNTKIAVQLFRVKDGTDIKLGTKVLTIGEYLKSGYVSFGRTITSADDQITYKTVVQLITNIEIGDTSDIIELLQSPRNKTEYTETFERTALPFFDKKPDDIMVLVENKIRIKKAIGVSYNIGSMGLLEIYDRDNNVLVEKEFTISSSDVVKGEVIFELDNNIPQIFTFRLYMQEPGKLPAVPYITSAFLSTWKIEKMEPKLVTKYVNIMIGIDHDTEKLVMSKYKFTIKKYPDRPLDIIKFKWIDYIDKRLGFKTDISDDITLEVVDFAEIVGDPNRPSIIPYRENIMLAYHVDSIGGLSYYSDITNKYDLIEHKSWGYVDMVNNPGDTLYDPTEYINISELNDNSKDIDGNTNIITLYAINSAYLGDNRYSTANLKLIYGYRIVNGQSEPVENNITLKYNRFNRFIDFVTDMRTLYSLDNNSKYLNDNVIIESMSLNTDLLKEITGIDPSKSFIDNIDYFLPEDSGRLWSVWNNNAPVDSRNTILYNKIVPNNINNMANKVDNPRINITSMTPYTPVLKSTNRITRDKANEYQVGFDWAFKEMKIHMFSAQGLSGSAYINIKYKKYRDGRKIYINLKDAAKYSQLTTSNGLYALNNDIFVSCYNSNEKYVMSNDPVAGYPETHVRSNNSLIQYDYALLEDKYVHKYAINKYDKWATGEQMPGRITPNGAYVAYRYIPTLEKWEEKAIPLTNVDISIFDNPNIKWCSIDTNMRGMYYDKLYATWKRLSTNISTVLQFNINPFDIKFKYNNNIGIKQFTPDKMIAITVSVPHGTKIDNEWLKYNLKFDSNVLSTTNTFTITNSTICKIYFNYSDKYITDETPLIFPDTLSLDEARDSINVLTNDFIVKSGNVVYPFNITSPLLISSSDMSVEWSVLKIPSYNISVNDNQYKEYNESLTETLTINTNLSEISKFITKNSEYEIHINGKYIGRELQIGDNFPYSKFITTYTIGSKDTDTYNIKYVLNNWTINKSIQIKRASDIRWDVDHTINNGNSIKFDFTGTNLDAIELYLYDYNKQKINIPYTIKVTDIDKQNGFKIIDIDSSINLSNKLTAIYRSIADSTDTIHYASSNVKCETRITRVESIYNTNLKVKFRLKEIPKITKYDRISGLVTNQYDYRTSNDWGIFSSKRPLDIEGLSYIGLDTELKVYNLNIVNFSKISADNIILPEGLVLAKPNWLNESTKDKTLIVGATNEVIIDVKLNINPLDRFEYNEYASLDFSGFGLKYDNNDIIREVSNTPLYTKKLKDVSQNDWPVELRFFLYAGDDNRRFYALYVWVPYKDLDIIKDYNIKSLIDNIDKYEYKLINQVYNDDNIYRPVSAKIMPFINILPRMKDIEEVSGISLKDFTIANIKNIAINTNITENKYSFILPEIQRYIKSNDKTTIINPILINSSGLNFKQSLQLDKLKTELTNYGRFIENGELANEANSKYKPVNIKNYKKFIVEFVNSSQINSINSNDIISIDISIVDIHNTSENQKNEYNKQIHYIPWTNISAMPVYTHGGTINKNDNNSIIENVLVLNNEEYKNMYGRNLAIPVANKLFNEHTEKLFELLIAFNPKLELLKSKINAAIIVSSIESIYRQSIVNITNPYQPICSIINSNSFTSELANNSGIYGYIYGRIEPSIKDISYDVVTKSKVIHNVFTIMIDSKKIEDYANSRLRSTGNVDYNIRYLPNKTGVYNTIADGTGVSYTNLDNVKHKYLYEISSTIDNDYLSSNINHYIFHLKDIIIDWEFIAGSHEVMIQDLLDINNIFNPSELGANTKCNINVTKANLNDKLKEAIPEYKGESLSDFNILDFIDNIVYKSTDKVLSKISLLDTNIIEPGEFEVNIKTNRYIPNLPSVFNRNNFFVKLDILTNYKYKYDINNEDRDLLEKHINNLSLILVINKKNNSVYEFNNINDYEYNTSKSKLFILKSKKLDKMEMIAKEFDKKWLLSKINSTLSDKIDTLLKKTISPSLKRILNTIKSSSIPTYEWFINGYDTNNLINDNIILSTTSEIKGSKLINAIINNIDYNYTIKDNMYLSVVKPLNLSIDLDVIPSDSWKLEFIYKDNTLYSTNLLEEPSENIIKNIWYSLNNNENLNIFDDNTINMYTNTTKKTVSVFAYDILEEYTLTLIFKSNMFSKEQRTFNITKYAHSNITEDEFWRIFQSSNIHNDFSTIVPNIIKYYDFTYDTTLIISMNTDNKSLDDVPDIYYGVNVNINLGSKVINRTIYIPNNATITYRNIYNNIIVPINIEHYLNDNIKRVYYTFDNYDKKINIDGMVNVNINAVPITEIKDSEILFNSSSLPIRETPIIYDIPIKNTDNVTRLLNSIHKYDTNHNTFITNIGDTSIDIESKYATFFELPANVINTYYSEPLKQVIRRLSLLDDSRLEQLSPRLNEVRRRAIIGNMPVTPSSVNIIDTTATTTKAIDVYNINITATDVNVYLNLPAYYDICYAINYEPGDMLTVARVITDFNIQNRVKISFKRTADINNSKILIAFFREDTPVVNPLIINVANATYTLAGNTFNIIDNTDINDTTKSLKIRGLIKMNDKTLPNIKPVKNSGLWLKQTSAIYDEYTGSDIVYIEDFYPLYHKTVYPNETIALVDKNNNIAYARTSSASCIVFRDGTEFYPIYNDISALKILSTKGVLRLY